jgi:TfoX/Sxy family transcriptional regulator of competence genes
MRSRKPPRPAGIATGDILLVERVRTAFGGVAKVKERRMFGSTAFLVRGNLCVTARPTRIMCRIDPATHSAAIKRQGCRTVVMKGRKYTGYVHIEASAVKTKRALMYWITRALKFNRTLPEATR